MWDKIDAAGERVVRAFSSDASKVFSAFIPSGTISFQLIGHFLFSLHPKLFCLFYLLVFLVLL